MDKQYRTLKQLLEHPEFREGQHWHQIHFASGEIVIREGECDHANIYVVFSGSLMVCTDVEVSQDLHLNSGLCELFDGEEFGLSCFFGDQPHSATVKTLSDCELAVVNPARLKVFLHQHPDIGYQILFHWLQCLLPRLRMDNRRIATLLSWGLKAHRIEGDAKPF